MWYSILDIFFFVFHTSLTLFNMLGWMFHKTRKWNLITLLLTAFSWFFLGIWYGWGYCLCTDWHYRVREKLGFHEQGSYIRFLVRKFTGKDFDEQLVETVTLWVFLVCLVASILLNIRDYMKKHRKLHTS